MLCLPRSWNEDEASVTSHCVCRFIASTFLSDSCSVRGLSPVHRSPSIVVLLLKDLIRQNLLTWGFVVPVAVTNLTDYGFTPQLIALRQGWRFCCTYRAAAFGGRAGRTTSCGLSSRGSCASLVGLYQTTGTSYCPVSLNVRFVHQHL